MALVIFFLMENIPFTCAWGYILKVNRTAVQETLNRRSSRAARYKGVVMCVYVCVCVCTHTHTVMKTFIAPVSFAWPTSKALQAQNHEAENTSPEESHIRYQNIGKSTNYGGYSRPKKVRFQTLTKTCQGFRRADKQGKFVPERRCTNAENSSSGLSLALRSR